MDKGLFIGTGVFQRLGERELEMQAVLVAQVVSLQRAPKREDVSVREPEGFEVGETPVGLTQRRLHGDGAAVGSHAVFLAARRFQRMTVAHPDLGLPRKVLEYRFVTA